MATAVLTGARWAATPVVAALAALAAQIVVYRTSIELLDVTVGIQDSSVLWAAKTFTSVFMGAAFVVVAWGVAPAAKRQAAIVALGIVVLWGARLMLSGFEGGLRVWLLAMGAAGIVGGALAFWRLWKVKQLLE